MGQLPWQVFDDDDSLIGEATQTQTQASIEAGQMGQESAQKAIDIYRGASEQARLDIESGKEASIEAMQPYLKYGTQAGDMLLGPEGYLTTGPVSPDQFQSTPHAQYLTDRMQDIVLGRASATGRRFSPATTKELMREAAGIASTDYDRYISRYYQRVNPLMDVMSAGQSAATTTAGIESGAARNLADVGISTASGEAGATMRGAELGAEALMNKANVEAAGKMMAYQTDAAMKSDIAQGLTTIGSMYAYNKLIGKPAADVARNAVTGTVATKGTAMLAPELSLASASDLPAGAPIGFGAQPAAPALAIEAGAGGSTGSLSNIGALAPSAAIPLAFLGLGYKSSDIAGRIATGFKDVFGGHTRLSPEEQAVQNKLMGIVSAVNEITGRPTTASVPSVRKFVDENGDVRVPLDPFGKTQSNVLFNINDENITPEMAKQLILSSGYTPSMSTLGI